MAWKIEDHTTLDKRFRVIGPGDVTLFVDYDDVNHEEVDAAVKAMVDRLNRPDPDAEERLANGRPAHAQSRAYEAGRRGPLTMEDAALIGKALDLYANVGAGRAFDIPNEEFRLALELDRGFRQVNA